MVLTILQIVIWIVTDVFVVITLVTTSVASVLTLTVIATIWIVTIVIAVITLVITSVASVITITIIMVSVLIAIPAVVHTMIVGVSVISVTTIMMAGELGQARKSGPEAVTALTVPQEEEEELSILMLETILY